MNFKNNILKGQIYYKSRSIQTKALLVAGVLFLTIFSFVYASSWLTLDSLFSNYLKNSARPLASLVAENAKIAIITQQDAEVVELGRFITSIKSVSSYALLDHDGKPFHKMGVIDLPNFKLPEIGHSHMRLNDNTWFIVSPVTVKSETLFPKDKYKEEIIGYVYLNFTTKNEMQYISSFNKYLLIIMFVAFFAGISVFVFFITRYLKPVEKMISAVKQFESGDNKNIDLETNIVEFSRLFENLKSMFSKITEQELNLREYNNNLEKAVEIKTKNLAEAVSKLEMQDQSKTEFIANASHEIRTPIQSIIGYTQYIHDELNEKEIYDFDEDFSRLERNCDKLLQLIKQILDFSKLESNTFITHLEEISISDLLEQIHSSTRMIVSNNQLFVVSDNYTDINTIKIDVSCVIQVVSNLVSNAEKFCDNGIITVMINASENLLNIEVKDNGIGVPTDQQEIIFEKFRQADGTSRRKYEGTGLGLSISTELAKTMNGTLVLDTSYTDGASFNLNIPL